MDDTHLAQEVVGYLTPFLRNLLAKDPLPTGANLNEQQAYKLWELIYPKVVLRSGVMQAARKIAEDDTSENRESLSMQLALVFRTNTFLAAEVQEQLSLEGRNRSVGVSGFQPKPLPQTPKVDSFAQEYGAEQVTCQVCGGQDETLRLVSYPFVFSLLVVTFRRMFQGVYCSRHASRYFFLAALITLSVGWLGIPFGPIFTPITLFNLFISEKRLRPANAKLLLEIAKAKQDHGKLGEAVVFYQESLWLDDNESAKLQTKQITATLIPEEQPSPIFQVFSLVSGFAGAWLMGFLIGLVDGIFSTPFIELEGQMSALVIIFSYIPLLLMLFLGGFVLARFIRWMLERTLISSLLIGRAIAGFAALISFYAILVGNLFYFVQAGGGQASANLFDTIRINGLLLVHGGWLTFVGLIQQGTSADLMFVVLVIFGLMLFFWLGQDGAIRTVLWRRALNKFQRSEVTYSGPLVGVSAILVVVIVFVIFGLIFFPSLIVLN
jgi:hypothetical protein